jgi:hypothetical protein
MSSASGLKSVLYNKDIIRIIYFGKLMMLLYEKYKVEIPTGGYVFTTINTNILNRYIIKIVNKLYEQFVSNDPDLQRIPKQEIKALLKMDIVAVCESFVELLPPDSGITKKEYEDCFNFKSIKNNIPKTRKSDKEAYESVPKLKQAVADGLTDHGQLLFGSE